METFWNFLKHFQIFCWYFLEYLEKFVGHFGIFLDIQRIFLKILWIYFLDIWGFLNGKVEWLREMKHVLTPPPSTPFIIMPTRISSKALKLIHTFTRCSQSITCIKIWIPECLFGCIASIKAVWHGMWNIHFLSMLPSVTNRWNTCSCSNFQTVV